MGESVSRWNDGRVTSMGRLIRLGSFMYVSGARLVQGT